MAKKALCVGINDYPYDGSDLNGCVNDATAWAELLIDHYEFAEEEVALLLDAEATQANIMSGLKDLVSGAEPGDVLLEIYDLTGRLVCRLTEGHYQIGTHYLQWGGCNEAGDPVSSGTYLLSFRTDRSRQTRKLTLLK